MTEKQIRTEIAQAEKQLQRLERQRPQLERLAQQASARYDQLDATGTDDAQLLDARVRRDAARAMLAENEQAQEAERQRIADLTAQAEQARLTEEHTRAVADLEAAKAEWRRAAEGHIRTLKTVLQEQERLRRRIAEACQRAEAAAVAADLPLDPGAVNALVNWSTIPGVSPLGVIEAGDMVLQPPLFKAEAAVAGAAIANLASRAVQVNAAGHDPNRAGGHLRPSSDYETRLTFSLKAMGIPYPEKPKPKPVQIPPFKDLT